VGADTAHALDCNLTIAHIDRECTPHHLHLIAPRS
jgi:hypothetical protein